MGEKVIYRTQIKQKKKIRVIKDMRRKTVKNIERCTFLVLINTWHWETALGSCFDRDAYKRTRGTYEYSQLMILLQLFAADI